MKWIKAFLVIFSTILVFPVIAMHSERANTIKAIQRQLLPVLKRYQIPGAAIVIYNHGQPYAFYYGNATIKPKTKVTSDTSFEVASISKVFTSVILAEEAQKGTVRLTSPMSYYIKNLSSKNTNFAKVSLEDLASHVNGFGQMPAPKIYNRNELIKSLAYWKPHHAVGTWWKYSNIGFGLLGYALDDATHLSYPALLKRDITIPLNMKDTSIVGSDCTSQSCAQGYGWTGLAVNTTKKLLIIPAAGSIRASGSDMLKFMAAAMGFSGEPKLLVHAFNLTEEPIYQSKYGAQALGWEVHNINNINKYGYLKNKPKYITLRYSPVKEASHAIPKAELMFGKTGSVAGFRSYMIIYPEQKTGIAVMVNRAMSRTRLVTATRRAFLMMLNHQGEQV